MCDKELLEICNMNKKSIDGEQYICIICLWNLKCNMMLVQVVINLLFFDDILEILKDLLILELILISKRIFFMKIFVLFCGKQKVVYGCVVNVLVNLEEICFILFCFLLFFLCIIVKLKCKIEYRGYVIVQLIRLLKIMEFL